MRSVVRLVNLLRIESGVPFPAILGSQNVSSLVSGSKNDYRKEAPAKIFSLSQSDYCRF